MVPSNDQQRGVDVIVDDSISHSCSAKQGIRIGQNLWTPGRKKSINIPEMIGWDSSGHCFSGGEAPRPRAQQRGPEWRGDPLRGGTAVAGSLAVAAAAAGKGLGAWDWG